MIENRVIALSLWDTAGQERYRSITKQYFRKADGIICMYDVTSEQSYKNLRNWITSIKVIHRSQTICFTCWMYFYLQK